MGQGGTPGAKVIGIDEISIRKGHAYRMGERPDPASSDLVPRRGSLGSEHETVLRLAGQAEGGQPPPYAAIAGSRSLAWTLARLTVILVCL